MNTDRTVDLLLLTAHDPDRGWTWVIAHDGEILTGGSGYQSSDEAHAAGQRLLVGLGAQVVDGGDDGTPTERPCVA